MVDPSANPRARPSIERTGKTLLYAYGVQRSVAHRSCDHLTIAGILPGCPVRTIFHHGLAFLVSDVPKAVFYGEAIRERLRDDAWVTARVLDHHRVLMTVPGDAVLPLQFCTLFTDRQAMAEALDRHRDDLLADLAAVHRAREWGVKLFVDYAALCRTVERTTPQLARLARRTAEATPGTAFFLKRKLDDTIWQTARDAAAARAEAIHEGLAAAARAGVRQPVRPRTLGGRQWNMLLNTAYLVPEEAEDRFRAVIDSLAVQHQAAGLRIELVGPLPPYSFAGTQVGDGRKGDVEERARS